MKIDNPVLLIGYNRPHNTLNQLQEFSSLDFRHLFISIDRFSDEMAEIFNTNLSNFQKMSNCTIKFQYSIKKNRLGLVQHIVGAIDDIFKQHDTLLIFEDDVLISSSGLVSLDRAFTNFLKNADFGAISGFSPISCVSKKQIFGNNFRKSIYFPCWGWGTTRKVWDNYKTKLNIAQTKADMLQSQSFMSLSKRKKKIWLGRFHKSDELPYRTWDMQFQYMIFRNNLRIYLPKFTLTGNNGFGHKSSTNTKDKKPFWVRSDLKQLQKKASPHILGFYSSCLFTHIDSMTFAGDSIWVSWISKNFKFLRKLFNKN